MIRCGGTVSSDIIELLVRKGTRSRPGIGGVDARPPTLMKTRSAVSVSSPTATVFFPVNLACPW
jgi:hypothetical protein